MIRPALAASLALTLLAACAATPKPERVMPCDITIRFGSYGGGVDRPLADSIAETAKADRDLAQTERKPWGREGEYDLCLSVKSGRDAKAIYQRYRAMLPAKALQAPTSITGPDGLMFETIAPM